MNTSFQLKNENRSLRNCLISLHALQTVLGCTVTAVGIASEIYLKVVAYEKRENFPVLWWFGIAIIVSGVCGLLSALKGEKLWMRLWLLLSFLLFVLAYVILIMVKALKPEEFGVTTQIYGMCSQGKDSCNCRWYEIRKQTILSYLRCSDIWLITTLYLLWICLIILSLSVQSVLIVTTAIAACCLEKCMTKNARPDVGTTAAFADRTEFNSDDDRLTALPSQIPSQYCLFSQA